MHISRPLTFLAVLSFCSHTSPAHAADPATSPLVWGDFSADVALRLRYEFVDWLDGAAPNTSSSYSFPHSKLQLGLKYSQPKFKAYVQGQYFQLYGLPDSGVGPGAVYYSTNDKDRHPGDFVLRQGWLEGNAGNGSITAGRFLYSSGSESLSKHAAVSWLRQKRISERVFGPFDFTGGRSFDGVRLSWNEPELGGVASAAFRPTQGGFATDASSQIEDVMVVASAVSADPKFLGSDSDLQFFHYFYQDKRGDAVVKVDNRDLDIRKADTGNIALHNFGLHWIDVRQFGGLRLDYLAWGLTQTGNWGADDHRAYAAAAEAGLRFEKVQWKPWIRSGYNLSSGDDDPSDGDHETFFQMLPTARQYAEVPFYNLMNNQDLFINVAVEPTEALSVRAGASYLWVSANEDLLYSGGGASKDHQFGFAGVPTGSGHDLGLLLNLHSWYKINSYAQVYLFYGHLFGGSALETSFPQRDDIDYAFAEVNLKF